MGSDHGTFKYKGIPILAHLGSVFGDTLFVDYTDGSTGNTGKTPDKSLTLLSAAYDKATTNNQDLILIDGNGAIVETDMITWSKSRTHVRGCDGYGHLGVGHGARITFGANDTPAAASLAPMKVTGWRNTFSNLKFESQCTTAESLYGHIDGGAYTTYNRCSFLKLSDLDNTSAADVVAGGNGTSWIECEIGAASLLTSVARHNMLVDKSVAGSNGMMDNHFKGCNFIAYTSDADRHFIHVDGTTDTQRYSMFRGCAFINWDIHGSGTTMTDAVHCPANTAVYFVFDANTIVVGCTNFAQSTDNAGIYICAAVPTTTTSGIAVNAA